jgi:phage-related protein
MKSAETKPAAKPAAKTGTPFFSKGGDGAYFFQNNKPIQPKLAVGPSNDKYEAEADKVADKVVQRLGKPDTRAVGPGAMGSSSAMEAGAGITPVVQRKCAECEHEEKLQKKEQDKDRELMPGTVQKKPIFESNARKEEQVQRKCADCEKEEKLQKKEGDGSAAGAPSAAVESSLRASKGSGAPLPQGTRTKMESSFGADFSNVRIHTGSSAVQMSDQLNAQAFTHGNDIYFNSGKFDVSSNAGQHLLAHELTHTVQQGASIRRKVMTPTTMLTAVPPATAPAPIISLQGIRGGNATTQTGEILQRDGNDDDESLIGKAWDATGGKVVGAATDYILDQMRSLAPDLVAFIEEVRREGIINYFKNKMMKAVNSIFDGLQNNSELISAIFPKFGELLARARVIVNALAAGDCKPLFAALNDLKDLVTKLAGEAWDAIVEFFQPAVDFFTDLWNSYALPALDWLKKKAADVWNWIKGLGEMIWNWFKPLRDAVSGAWDYIKGILGLNADETGEEGLIQWVQRKAGEIWDSLKEELRPIIEPAKAMIARIQEIIPLTAILHLRETIQDWLKKVADTATTMGDDAGNVGNEAAQTSLRDQILPAIQQSIEHFRGSITAAGAWVNSKIGEVYAAVTQFFTTIKSINLLNLASGLIGWVETKVSDLNNWVQAKVTALFDIVSEGLHHVGQWLRPIYDMLVKILGVLKDLLGKLPDFLMGPLWMMLPECIKEKIKKFFIEQILSRMSFFQKLKKLENIWERLEAMAITILKQIFIDGNLRKAIWTFYSSMLDIIGLPPQLVTKVIAKAAKNLSDLLNDPLGFLLNFVHALKLGFEQFFDKIGTYLLSGLQAWLFDKMKGTGIEMPKEFTFMSMLKFAFQVLGITVDMLLEVLEEVTGKKGLKAKIEKKIGVIASAFEWFEKLMNSSEDGGSFEDRLEKAIGNIWDFILDAVVGWLETNIVKKALAWVAEKLDPTGVMAVITTIIDVFNVIEAIVEKAKEIFQMIDKVLDGFADLIKGILGAAATVFEKALGAAIPVVMAILASLFGLDDVVDEVKEAIEDLRKKIREGVKSIMTTIKGWIEKWFGEEDDGTDDIAKALSEIDTEANADSDDGEVKKDEADAIKEKVNKDHPSVIEITSVKDSGETWDFEYVQKASKKIPKSQYKEPPVKQNDTLKVLYIEGKYLAKVDEIHKDEAKPAENYIQYTFNYKKLTERTRKNSFSEFWKEWNAKRIEKIDEIRKYLMENRPSHKAGFRDEVWKIAETYSTEVDPQGKKVVRDPNVDTIVLREDGPWDAGHKKDQKYSKQVDYYINGDITEGEFLEAYHDPMNYHPEDVNQNRSHRNE